MNAPLPLKWLAWGIALTLVALPIVGVLNGWFAAKRWPVSKIELRAEYAHVSAEQIRATVESHLAQGFFAVQLTDVQAAVAQLPWVERVEARKQWPDTLRLTVYERQPFAHWGRKRLLSRNGEIFEVPGAESMQGLPQLSGPDERLPEVLAFHAECMREFSGSGLTVSAVELDARGSWRLTLASGALIEVGRVDASYRLRRFLDVWPKLAVASNGPPVYIDLRYENGFALRWALPEPLAQERGRQADAAKERRVGTVWSGSNEALPMTTLLASVDSAFSTPHSRLLP